MEKAQHQPLAATEFVLTLWIRQIQATRADLIEVGLTKPPESAQVLCFFRVVE